MQILKWLGGSLLLAAGVVGFCAVLYFGFQAHGVRHYNDGEAWDGLGRKLYRAPWLVQLIILPDARWAGWKWAALDAVWQLGGIYASIVCCGLGSMAWTSGQEKNRDRQESV